MKSSTFVYEETPLIELLVLSSFIYLLNAFGSGLEKLLHAGLIAQIGVGIVYGPPLGNILPQNWLGSLQALGNLGLILLVFQGMRCSVTTPFSTSLTVYAGGLSTKLDLLKANIVLSITVALVGILVPIGLSLICFVYAFGDTPLQGFTAGAALCSTSLGTTFAILSSLQTSVNLRSTRIGVVLLSAAIIDDVVGLIMASVVATVTAPDVHVHGKRLAWIILQPVIASGGMAGVTSIIGKWLLLPAYRKLISRLGPRIGREVLLVMLIAVLSGMVAISNYTGSSMLFGAYSAGCLLQFLDTTSAELSIFSFEDTFEVRIRQYNDHIFVPFFFSSIGLAIPFTSLWKGSILWKGAVYSLLMWLGKATTGICILLWPEPADQSIKPENNEALRVMGRPGAEEPGQANQAGRRDSERPPGKEKARLKGKKDWPLYPALLLSLAMVSRGEIALLIAQLGVPTLGEEDFLVVMWATVLCTLIGAVTTGQLVHRRFNECTRNSWG